MVEKISANADRIIVTCTGKSPVELVLWEISLAADRSTEPRFCCVMALLSSRKNSAVPGAVFFSEYNRSCHDNFL